MMLGGVANDGTGCRLTGLRQGVQVNMEVYLHVVKPWIDATYLEGNYVFQENSAPSSKSKIVQEWCTEYLPFS